MKQCGGLQVITHIQAKEGEEIFLGGQTQWSRKQVLKKSFCEPMFRKRGDGRVSVTEV
jgi:hypothetical protein